MENNETNDFSFDTSKPFDYWLKKKDNPVTYCLLTLDGNEFLVKNSYTVELIQKTAEHDVFTITVPDDALDSFEGYVMENSKNLIGKDIIIVYNRYGEIRQNFAGIIGNITNKKGNGSGYGKLCITGYSPSILLENGDDCQSFEDKTLEQIIKDVTVGYPEEAKIAISANYLNEANTKSLLYTVQYKESDYQFIRRLAVRHGEFFYYNGEKLVFGNKVEPIIKLGQGIDLMSVEFEMKIGAQDFKYIGYDTQSGSKIEKDSSSIRSEFKESLFQSIAVIASGKIFRKKPKMHFNHTGIQNWSEGQLEEAVRLEKERRENLVVVRGKSRDPGLRIGGRAELTDINAKAMETYRIIEIKHYHSGNKYYNEFVGIPDFFNAAPYIDIEAVPKGEAQPARVTENNDPMGMGRVRVQFPWQEDKNQMTPWIRTTTIYAGAGRGDYKIPEIGDEVLVNHKSGNAEQPYVSGALYNGAETSGFHTPNNDLKVEKTRSGVKEFINDAEGSWKQSTPDGNYFLQDGKGNAVMNVPNNLTFNIGGNFNVNVGKNLSFLVGMKAIYNIGVQMIMNTPFLKYFVTDNYHLQSPKTLINGDGEIKIEAKETSVAATQKLFMHSEEKAVINSKGVIEVKGQSGTSNTNIAENLLVEEIILDAKALVVFRPHSTWEANYDFSFDWYREGFGGGTALGGTSLKGDEDFKTIAGHYLNNNYNSPFVLDTSIAERVKSEYLKAVAHQKDKPYDYFVPKLAMYKHELEVSPSIANISVNFEVYEEPDEFILEYEGEFFDIKEYVDPNGIVLIGKASSKSKSKVVKKLEYNSPENYKNYKIKPKKVTTAFQTIDITIECKKTFGTLEGKYIKAYTLQEGSDPKDPIKKLAGILQVMPNDASNRKIVNLLMINIITDIDADGKQEFGYDTVLLEKEKKTIRTFLRQSLIDPVFSIINLDLSGFSKIPADISIRDHFNSTYISGGALLGAYESGSTIPTGWKNLDIYLYEKFNDLPDSGNFTNHTRLFYLPQDKLNIIQNNVSNPFGGYNSGSNHLNIILPKQGSNAASSHEIYHSLGLAHPWQNKNNINRSTPFNPTEENGKYSFKYQSTYNVMDYVFPQYCLYYWQSKIARNSATAEPATYTPQI